MSFDFLSFCAFRGSLGVFPYLENFVFKSNSLSVALADLLPLLRQSIDWFESLVREQEIMSKVRSSELEIGLSFNDGPVEAGGDTAVSTLGEVKAFHTLDEVCGLDANTLSRFKDRFQFPNRDKVRLPSKEELTCHFFPGEVCFYEATFLCGLRLPVHPFVMELLSHFGIAPKQLMPNSWRIVVSLMGIWLATTDSVMIRVDKLIYLYHLKASKEHGYYELVSWERRTRIVRNLPSSFRYWKSRFFFMSEDDWEMPSNKIWGDLPRLLHRWSTPNLGVSLFLLVVNFQLCLFIFIDPFLHRLLQLRDGLSLKASTRDVLRR